VNHPTYEVPLTSGDLRAIAKTLDDTARKFGEEDNLTAFGSKFYDIELVVMRPDSGEQVGVIAYYDGWLGFHPYATERTLPGDSQ
jgi:hypothetical protein